MSESATKFLDRLEPGLRYGDEAFSEEERLRLLSLARRGAGTQWRPLKDAPDDDQPVLLLLKNKDIVIAPAAAAMATVRERSDIYKRTGEWPSFTGYEPLRWLPLSALGVPSDE